MKLTIFKRLTIGYFLIMGLVVYLGAYAILKLNQINLIIKEIDSIDAAAIRLTEHLSDSLFSQINFEKKYLVSKDPDFYQQFIQIAAAPGFPSGRSGISDPSLFPAPDRPLQTSHLHRHPENHPD